MENRGIQNQLAIFFEKIIPPTKHKPNPISKQDARGDLAKTKVKNLIFFETSFFTQTTPNGVDPQIFEQTKASECWCSNNSVRCKLHSITPNVWYSSSLKLLTKSQGSPLAYVGWGCRAKHRLGVMGVKATRGGQGVTGCLQWAWARFFFTRNHTPRINFKIFTLKQCCYGMKYHRGLWFSCRTCCFGSDRDG